MSYPEENERPLTPEERAMKIPPMFAEWLCKDPVADCWKRYVEDWSEYYQVTPAMADHQPLPWYTTAKDRQAEWEAQERFMAAVTKQPDQ